MASNCLSSKTQRRLRYARIVGLLWLLLFSSILVAGGVRAYFSSILIGNLSDTPAVQYSVAYESHGKMYFVSPNLLRRDEIARSVQHWLMIATLIVTTLILGIGFVQISGISLRRKKLA